MEQSNKAIEQLNSLLGKDKFQEDMATFYPGCPDPELRKKLNNKANISINEFVDAVKNNRHGLSIHHERARC